MGCGSSLTEQPPDPIPSTEPAVITPPTSPRLTAVRFSTADAPAASTGTPRDKPAEEHDIESALESSNLAPHLKARAKSIIERRCSVNVGDVSDAIEKARLSEVTDTATAEHDDIETALDKADLAPHLKARAKSIIERRCSVNMSDVNDAIEKVRKE